MVLSFGGYEDYEKRSKYNGSSEIRERALLPISLNFKKPPYSYPLYPSPLFSTLLRNAPVLFHMIHGWGMQD